MKRLLAAGGEAIYQVCKVFRGAERGRLHNPEFTLVEWYRRGDSMADGMALLSDLCERLLARARPNGSAMPKPSSGTSASIRIAPTSCALRSRAAEIEAGRSPALQDLDRDGWLEWLLDELVAPQLGVKRPTILYDYPASQAALAQVRAGDPAVAERFELYVDGIELANGYHELLDPEVLATRNAAANRQRSADGKPTLPEDSRLLAAMRYGLPPCSGVALGFDRLVMLAAGATSLDAVLAFPIERA